MSPPANQPQLARAQVVQMGLVKPGRCTPRTPRSKEPLVVSGWVLKLAKLGT
jgi:hypothetical protein